MMTTTVSIFVMILLVPLVAVLFIMWMVFLVMRGAARGISGLAAVMLPRRWARWFQFGPNREKPCPNAACKAFNPASARFCRRCGSDLSVSARALKSSPALVNQSVNLPPLPQPMRNQS